MNTNYLDLDFKTATFYQYSKIEKEDFKAHTADNGTVSYRKTFPKGVYGVLQSVDLKETNFGYKIALRLLNGDEVYVCNIGLHSGNKQIDNRFAEPVICLLPNLVKGQAYRIFPYSLDKELEGTTKTFYGVSIKLADLDKEAVLDAVLPAFRRRRKDEEVGPNQVPSLVFEKKLTGNKPTLASIGAREDFLEDLLSKSLVSLAYTPNNAPAPAEKAAEATAPRQSKLPSTGGTNAKAPKAPPTPKAPEPETLYTEDDDLPF